MPPRKDDASRWRRLLRLPLADTRADVDDELRFHIETSVRELVAGGLEPAAARAEAERRFGALEAVRAQCLTIDERRRRRAQRADTMSGLLHDVRYALRAVRKTPAFSFVVALTLGLGIGATTAMYGVVDGVLVRPLPYAAPGRLVALADVQRDVEVTPASFSEYQAWKKAGDPVFTDLAAWVQTQHTLTGGCPSTAGACEPEVLAGDRMSASLPRMLGVTPVLGRSFRDDEEPPTGERVAMISEAFWRRRFGGDPAILGRALRLNGQPHIIVGVFPSSPVARTPSDLSSGRRADVWLTLRLDEQRAPRGLHFLNAAARLRPGVELPRARGTMAAAVAHARAAGMTPHDVKLEPLSERIVGSTRWLLATLLGAVSLVLVIACVNVASLLMARASIRQQEIAIRVALGAGRERIVAQLLAESVARALLGGALGIGLAYLSIGALHRYLPTRIPRFDQVRVDGRVLFFAVALSVLTGILFGLVPALRASHGDLVAGLREGGRGLFGSLRRDRFRRMLVVAEIALSFVLLVGAGLLLRSFAHLVSVRRGFDAEHVLTAFLALPSARYGDDVRQRAFWQEVEARLNATPGIDAVGLSSSLPVEGGVNGGISIEGRTFPPESEPIVEKRVVSAGYLPAIRARLVAGRGFDARDAAGAPPVVVVNEAFVRRWMGKEAPIGKRVDFAWGTTGMQTIVGVIADMKEEGLSEPPSPALYIPVSQRASDAMYIVVRGPPEPSVLTSAVRREVLALDRDLPVSEVRALSDVATAGLASQRLSMSLLGAFSILALALAAVGLYGVISYAVIQRTQELGIRAALGAQRTDLLRLVLRQGVAFASAGIVAGVVGALASERVIASQLFGVGTGDPATYVGVALLLTGVALVATAIPALRAARIDPLVALRQE